MVEGRVVRRSIAVLTTNERKQMSNLKEKLEQANKKVEKQRAERRARVIKGSHLTDTFVKLATDAGCDVRPNTGFHVIVGRYGKGRRIYVAKRGGIVDLLGFSVDHPAIRQVSKEEAQAKHMGKVQGRFLLDGPDEQIVEAFTAAVNCLNEERTEPVKPPRAKKVAAPTTETQPTA
jgi:hypothetical protein